MEILLNGKDGFSWCHNCSGSSVWNNSIVIVIHKDTKYSSSLWWNASLISYFDRVWSRFSSLDKFEWWTINDRNDCSFVSSISREMFLIFDIFDGSLAGKFFIGTRLVDLSNPIFVKLEANTFGRIELDFSYECLSFVVWWWFGLTNDAEIVFQMNDKNVVLGKWMALSSMNDNII